MGIWFSGEHGGAGLTVRLDDLTKAFPTVTILWF